MSLKAGRFRSLKYSLSRLASAALSALAIVFLSACNDAPTDVGYSLLNDTVNVRSVASSPDTLLISSAGSAVYFEELFNTGRMFVGSAHGMSAAALVRFSKLPDSLADLSAGDIVSVNYIVYVNRYALGDTSGGELRFDAKKIEKTWTDSATWENLTEVGFTGNSVGSFAQHITYKDSAFISIPIDANLVVEWSRKEGDTIPVNHGIALVPSSGVNVVNSFFSQGISQTAPPGENRIEITYRNKSGQTVTYKLNSAIEKTVIKAPEFDPNAIEVMGATVLYAKMNFDIPESLIPRLSGIHKAELVLTTDFSRTRYGNFGMPKYILGNYSDQYESAPNNVPSFEGGWMSATDSTKFVFPNIISAIERITRKGGKGSIIIRPYDFSSQYYRADRVAFFGSNDPDPDKRPKLRIIYSYAPSIK